MAMSIRSTISMPNKELKQKAKSLEPSIRIGKSGLTESAISEIKMHLKNKKLVKVKFLRPFAQGKDKKMLAKELAEKTNSILVDRVGFIAVLYQNRNV